MKTLKLTVTYLQTSEEEMIIRKGSYNNNGVLYAKNGSRIIALINLRKDTGERLGVQFDKGVDVNSDYFQEMIDHNFDQFAGTEYCNII